jgi:hypothetical protein
MNGGQSYRVAHPPFVVSRPAHSRGARAPPRRVVKAGTYPEDAKGLAEAPPAPANQDPTRRRLRKGVEV